MNRKDLIFAAIAVAVIGLFIFLSMIGRKATPMSSRAEHAGLSRDTPRETCWACHALDSPVAPMPANHPKKGKPPDQTTPCHACHKLPDMAAEIFYPINAREELSLWLNQQQK